MSKLKVGIIGCGGIANNKHLPALKSQSALCEIVAFCDTEIERAEKMAKQYGTADAKVYIASEYEGHHFDETIDSEEQLRHFVALMTKNLEA